MTLTLSIAEMELIKEILSKKFNNPNNTFYAKEILKKPIKGTEFKLKIELSSVEVEVLAGRLKSEYQLSNDGYTEFYCKEILEKINNKRVE
jgi:hypothetical protein